MTVLAIDPGSEQSAFVVYDGERPITFDKIENERMLCMLRYGSPSSLPSFVAEACAIETLKPRGMPTSFEEMQTQLWAGRFYEAWFTQAGNERTQVFRHDVKIFHCGRANAKDSNIRAALIDRFGGKEKAIGEKATPGPLHGIANDCWSALAIATYFWDTQGANHAITG